jgi:hypothetical protein
MPPEKIDSLADDVKPLVLVLGLLRQISGLTARVGWINTNLLARALQCLAQIVDFLCLSGAPRLGFVVHLSDRSIQASSRQSGPFPQDGRKRCTASGSRRLFRTRARIDVGPLRRLD